jgi:hypothetical protein
VVSWVDNLIRPLVISSDSQIPFLLVMFGVLGEIGTFRLVGMFVGPVIMAVLMAVWREWLEDAPPTSGRERTGRPPALRIPSFLLCAAEHESELASPHNRHAPLGTRAVVLIANGSSQLTQKFFAVLR